MYPNKIIGLVDLQHHIGMNNNMKIIWNKKTNLGLVIINNHISHKETIKVYEEVCQTMIDIAHALIAQADKNKDLQIITIDSKLLK